MTHPEYFWDDLMHLRPEGAAVYARLIAAAVGTPWWGSIADAVRSLVPAASAWASGNAKDPLRSREQWYMPRRSGIGAAIESGPVHSQVSRFMKRFVLIVVAFAVLAGSVSLVDSMLPAIAGPTPTAVATPVAGQPRAVLTSRGSDGAQATPTLPPRAPEAVTAIGDSVMLASTADLQAAIANITIDAVVGRQVPAALAVLRERKAAGPLGSVVVIHMGTNGYFTAQQFDEMMQLVAGTRRVVFVNVKCPTGLGGRGQRGAGRGREAVSAGRPRGLAFRQRESSRVVLG